MNRFARKLALEFLLPAVVAGTPPVLWMAYNHSRDDFITFCWAYLVVATAVKLILVAEVDPPRFLWVIGGVSMGLWFSMHAYFSYRQYEPASRARQHDAEMVRALAQVAARTWAEGLPPVDAEGWVSVFGRFGYHVGAEGDDGSPGRIAVSVTGTYVPVSGGDAAVVVSAPEYEQVVRAADFAPVLCDAEKRYDEGCIGACLSHRWRIDLPVKAMGPLEFPPACLETAVALALACGEPARGCREFAVNATRLCYSVCSEGQ